MEIATSALPNAESRPGQKEMAQGVEEALQNQTHLVVQAGTGTGKTIAYLVPAILSGKRVVISTATKALQDQLAKKDLPFLAEHLGPYLNREISFAVLKGRSNYVCMQRVAELHLSEERAKRDDSPTLLEVEEMSDSIKREVTKIATWAQTSTSGDMDEITWSPSERATSAVSVGSDECPGARRCPQGGQCFSELARLRAGEAEIVVVNTYLYGLHVASDGELLPEHEVLIVDEAHGLEDIMSSTVGVTMSAGNFNSFAGITKRIIADPKTISDIVDIGHMLNEVLQPDSGKRISAPLPNEVTSVLAAGRRVVAKVLDILRVIETKDDDSNQRKLRAQTMATRLAETLDAALQTTETDVPFVSGTTDRPILVIAPLNVGPTLSAGIWQKTTAILTSATIPTNMPQRVGLPNDRVNTLDVESPFDYQSNAMLYCSGHLPNPNDASFGALMHEELFHLILAAGGRTLALFTSIAKMNAAAAALRDRLPHTIFTQGEYKKTQILKLFSEDESSCLFATQGFFQGIDIPGRTLSLVTLDRIPFPRPDEPLMKARRDAVGPSAFREIDLPRAATSLAQATGRLIRNATDRGVVAVFDSRLANSGYRSTILNAMPKMRRTLIRSEAEDFLRTITE
ncbi:putative ATP-dependent helicase DinG [Actinomycetes bacterium]|nr:putative ATP-dependent helicase DinG [Actinomycetes bacterium]